MSKQIVIRPEDSEDIQEVYKNKKNMPVFKRKFYENELHKLEIELLKFQKWVIDNKKRVLVIMEGRDGAGKGGTIKALTSRLNPRAFRVVALQKPTELEKHDWYFTRYIANLPKPGEIVLFDRSWYNRAGVERVMGFCTQEEYKEFMMQVLNLEQMLIQSGLIIFKYFLDVSQEEQKRRIERRKTDPLRMWKLSPIDNKSLNLWEEYTETFQKMFSRTHNTESPWILVNSTDKKRARINLARDLLSRVDYEGKDQTKVCLLADPSIVTQYSYASFFSKKHKDKHKNEYKALKRAKEAAKNMTKSADFTKQLIEEAMEAESKDSKAKSAKNTKSTKNVKNASAKTPKTTKVAKSTKPKIRIQKLRLQKLQITRQRQKIKNPNFVNLSRIHKDLGFLRFFGIFGIFGRARDF